MCSLWYHFFHSQFCSTGEVGEGSIKPSHEVEMGIILDESGAVPILNIFKQEAIKN